MTKLTTWSATGLLILTCVFPSVENESHCDFVKLREMLIRVNMEDLREQTHARHYELYRRCKLEEMGFKDTDPDSQPFRYRGRESNTHYPPNHTDTHVSTAGRVSIVWRQYLIFSRLFSLCSVFSSLQPPGDVRGQEERVPGRPAAQRGRNATNVRQQSKRDGSRAERKGERGQFKMVTDTSRDNFSSGKRSAGVTSACWSSDIRPEHQTCLCSLCIKMLYMCNVLILLNIEFY